MSLKGLFSKLFSWTNNKKLQDVASKVAQYSQEILPLSMALAAAGFKPAEVADTFLANGIKVVGELQSGTLTDTVKTIIESTLENYVMNKYGINSTTAKLVTNGAYLVVQNIVSDVANKSAVSAVAKAPPA